MESLNKREFNMTKYFETLEVIIKNILLRPKKEFLTYDILDTETTIQFKTLVLQENRDK